MIERRVATLEEGLKDIKSILGRIDERLRSIEVNVAELKGRVEGIGGRIGGVESRLSAMPTTWQLLTFTIGAVLGSAGLAFAIARLLKS